MKTVEVKVLIEKGMYDTDHWLLLPRPINDDQVIFNGFEIDGVSHFKEITASNSMQRAYLVNVSRRVDQIIACYRFEESISHFPEAFWSLQQNRYTQASDELIERAKKLSTNVASQHEIVDKIISHASRKFGYGHMDKRFNDGCLKVPEVCGTTKGSCVDINTYILAMATSLGIRGQYMAGYWFHPDKTMTHDMHCWLVFKLEDEVVYWDLAHHLKYGVPQLAASLNPAGGRRVPMSMGRGLRFETPVGEIEVSHFSEPLVITNGPQVTKPGLLVQIFE